MCIHIQLQNALRILLLIFYTMGMINYHFEVTEKILQVVGMEGDRIGTF